MVFEILFINHSMKIRKEAIPIDNNMRKLKPVYRLIIVLSVTINFSFLRIVKIYIRILIYGIIIIYRKIVK